jgi:UDP-glucose 4-epimerase
VRALVTGSSGFLGRHVAEHLSSRGGCDVTGFDLRPRSSDNFATVAGDLCDLDAVVQAVQGMDIVVHFGGVGDVDLATTHPELAATANVVGTTNIGLAARQAGARVVYASTWEVYGSPLYDPVDERHPCNPAHAYGVTKLAGEQMLRAAHHGDDLHVAILRIGTAYGSGMRPNAVFSRFSEGGRSGLPIVVHGSGRQWRQFTHTSDIARAVELAIGSSDPFSTLNIVSEESVTILQLAELVSRRYGVPVTFGSEREGDAPSARISSEAAGLTLGWRAEVAFADGLSELLSQFDGGWDRNEAAEI